MGVSSSKEVQLYKEAYSDIRDDTRNAYERAMGNIKDAYAKAAEMSKEDLKLKAQEIKDKQELISHGIALLEIQKSEIKELKQQLEELLKEKLFSKETELDNFIDKLKLNYRGIIQLKELYQVLIRARENFNQDEIDAVNSRIEEMKNQALRDIGTSSTKIRELFRSCEEVVELEERLSKICQQQYEARQEAAQTATAVRDYRFRNS